MVNNIMLQGTRIANDDHIQRMSRDDKFSFVFELAAAARIFLEQDEAGNVVFTDLSDKADHSIKVRRDTPYAVRTCGFALGQLYQRVQPLLPPGICNMLTTTNYSDMGSLSVEATFRIVDLFLTTLLWSQASWWRSRRHKMHMT